MNNNKNKNAVISFRCTEEEYLDILLKISDENGKQVMSAGAFSRAATLAGHVTIVDSEVERYKAYISGNIANNMNQIAYRLNSDNLAGILSEKTYLESLHELKKIREELTTLLDPVR